MNMSKKKLLAIALTLTTFLAMFTLLPITAVATEFIDVDNYCWIEGVLHNDTYGLYPYAQESIDIGFSKYGEMIGYNEGTGIGLGIQYPGYSGAADPVEAPDGTYDQEIETSVDPFANEYISIDNWMNGWFIDIKYTPMGATISREIWAFALFSDGLQWGGDWIKMPSTTSTSLVRPLWQEFPPYANPSAEPYVTAGELTSTEAEDYMGGRKSNGDCETDPIEIIYNGPRRFIALCRTMIKDGTRELVDITFTIVFNKAEKNVIILKDLKRLYKKSDLNIQFGNRGEWDLGVVPHTDSYVHWFTDEPVQQWDMDGGGTITEDEAADSFEFFKDYFLANKYPKKWWDEVPDSEIPDYIYDEWAEDTRSFPGDRYCDDISWNETQETCYGREWHRDSHIKEHSYAVAQVISEEGDYVGALAVWPHPEFWAADMIYYPPKRTVAPAGNNPSMIGLMLTPISRMLNWHKWTVEEDPNQGEEDDLDDRDDIWIKMDDITDSTGTATAEPTIPKIIYEHDIKLKSAIPNYRIVSVYVLTDNHDGDDRDAQRGDNEEDWSNGINQIDREVQYQLDEIFNPWDIYDAMHKNTKRWVQFFSEGVAGPGIEWTSENREAWNGEDYYCIELDSSREVESGKVIPSLPVYPGFEPGTRPDDWDNRHGYCWDAYCAFTERVLVDSGSGYELIPRGISDDDGKCTLAMYDTDDMYGYHWLDPTKVAIGAYPTGRRFYIINFNTGRICFYEFDSVTKTFDPWPLPEGSVVKVLWSSEHYETTAEQWDEDHPLYPVDGERVRFPLYHDIMCKYKNLTEVFLVEQPPERIPEVEQRGVGSMGYYFMSSAIDGNAQIEVYDIPLCKEIDVKYWNGSYCDVVWHEEKFHSNGSSTQVFNLTYAAVGVEKVWIHSEKALTGGDYVYDNSTCTIYMQDPVPDCHVILVNYTCCDGVRYGEFFHGDGETTEFELECCAVPGTLNVSNTEILQQIVNDTATPSETPLGIHVPKTYPCYWASDGSGDYQPATWVKHGDMEEREWLNITHTKVKGNYIIRESPAGDYFSTCDELVLEQPPLNSSQTEDGWPGQELKIVFKVPSGRWEWSIVGEPSVAVDSIGATMTVAAFKNKLIEFGLGGLDVQDATYGPRIPWMISQGTSPDSIGRYHIRDDWCSYYETAPSDSWPMSSSNVITVGGPYPNMVSKYFNEFAQAMIFTTIGDGFYAVTCWDKQKPLSEHGFYEGGEVTDQYGYAVISTYKDKNGTIGFMVYGWTGQDTYYAAKWFDEHKFELQHINLHVTDLVLEIEYEDSEGVPYCPPTVSIVEKLGTISEKPQHDP